MNIINQLRRLTPDRALTTTEARAIAELQANRLLQLTDCDQPAVPNEVITELPRISVTEDTDMLASGATTWTGGQWRIQLRSTDHPLRQRFSLAHEFKHILDHPFVDKLYAHHEPGYAETISDHFAACVLMPRAWVKTTYASGIQHPKHLARRFGVSQAAMTYRLHQLGLTEPAPRCPPLRWKPTYRRAAALAGGIR